MMMASDRSDFVRLAVPPIAWVVAVGAIVALLLFDILVLHRKPKVLSARRAAIETVAWILVGVCCGLVVIAVAGGGAGGEWFSGYLIEYSLSIDNVFVWALILTHFAVQPDYQHRVLFWGVFGALVLRAGFIFAGVALVQRFEFVLFLFGAFLLYTAAKLVIGDDLENDPTQGRFIKLIRRVVPSTEEIDGPHLFTHVDGRRLATPLFAVLVLVEVTDVLFAVDSVPAVLAVSNEQIIVFTSNAFAIMGLRSLYFLLANMRARFAYLQQGLAVILAFVGIKMIISRWVHISTPISLIVIALVLASAVGFSLSHTRAHAGISMSEDPPPLDER
ncbi:MAG: putative TerC family integral rane protein [Ilumatobacteraceae bacterium]|jgi:tellurite resistance protein TerC|nr:putative TerC family integral rane protein [Ilumatobacteraceae bacterium]